MRPVVGIMPEHLRFYQDFTTRPPRAVDLVAKRKDVDGIAEIGPMTAQIFAAQVDLGLLFCNTASKKNLLGPRINRVRSETRISMKFLQQCSSTTLIFGLNGAWEAGMVATISGGNKVGTSA